MTQRDKIREKESLKMPIYEYQCNSCESKIEVLVGVGVGTANVSCSNCGGSDLKKLFSAFGTKKEGSSSACGSCTSSSCSSCS